MPAAYRAAVLAFIAFAPAVMLGACAARDPLVDGHTGIVVGNWQIERALDRVTQRPVSSAFVHTRTVSNADIAFPPPATMQLSCFKGRPIVRFEFGFRIGSTRNAQLGYVFDGAPGREPEVRVVDGYKIAVIENGDEVARFTAGLAGARTLYVRIRSLNAGRTSAEFEVHGAHAAIASAYAGCPPAAAAPGGDPKPKNPGVAQNRAAADPEPEDAPESTAASPTEEAAVFRPIGGWFGRVSEP